MPFHQVGVPAGSSFKHILSGRTFVLERFCTSEDLISVLYYENADGQKFEAGHAKAASEFHRHLALGPLDSNSHFAMTYIRTEDAYRNISLGTVLLFIIAREVQVNDGVYLYIQYPVLEALGFYCQFGFYPAPENVQKRHFRAIEEIRQMRRILGFDDLDHQEIPVQDKIKMSRSFSLWRGAINQVIELLTKKLEGLYTFG